MTIGRRRSTSPLSLPPGAGALVSQATDGAGDPDGTLKGPSLPVQRSPSFRLPGRDL